MRRCFWVFSLSQVRFWLRAPVWHWLSHFCLLPFPFHLAFGNGTSASDEARSVPALSFSFWLLLAHSTQSNPTLVNPATHSSFLSPLFLLPTPLPPLYAHIYLGLMLQFNSPPHLVPLTLARSGTCFMVTHFTYSTTTTTNNNNHPYRRRR